MSSRKEAPQKVENENLRPPGYHYETALARHREHEAAEESSWKEIEGHAPNSTRTLFALQPGGEAERFNATYQYDGTFWAYSRWGEDTTPPEETLQVVSRDTYYREHIATPVARGEKVTRYVVPDHPGHVTTSEEKARSRADRKSVDWSEVRADEGLRLLHSKGGTYSGWAYWSDGKMTPGVDKEEAGDMTAAGNGAFSEDAEDLLGKLWEGGKSALEHFENGKERLARVEEVLEWELTGEAVGERYGLSSYNFSNHHVELRRVRARHEEGEDAFYVLEEIYSGMSGDGYVNKNYGFFDEEDEALSALHGTYAAERVRKSSYAQAMRDFEEATTPQYTYYDEEGNEVESPWHMFGKDGEVRKKTTYPDVERPALDTPQRRLLFGLNHYLPTGAGFAEGVTYESRGRLAVTLATSSERDERSLAALQKRLEETQEAGVEAEIVGTMKGRRGSRTKWHELRVDEEDVEALAEALLAESGPHGWGRGYELMRSLELIEEKPTREKPALWERSDLHFIGVEDGRAVGSNETKVQIQQMQVFGCALADAGGSGALSWEDVTARLRGIVEDRKARIDEGTMMADRPAFAIAQIEDGDVVRLEVYRGHDRLALEEDLRAPQLLNEEIEPTFSE